MNDELFSIDLLIELYRIETNVKELLNIRFQLLIELYRIETCTGNSNLITNTSLLIELYRIETQAMQSDIDGIKSFNRTI